MALRLNMVLLSVLGTLLVFHSLCVHGAVERAIFTSRELHRRVRSSFYVLGYCSSPVSPECIRLTLLLESSEAFTRDGLIKTGLLVYDTASWQKHLNTSTSTHLWFACHDGEQIKLKSINSTAPEYAAEALKVTHHMPSDAALRAARAAASAADCSPGVPFYACPQLPSDVRIDLLMLSLAAAMQQQAAACIAGQMRNMHPAAAAAISTGIVLPDAAAVAAAVAAHPETMKRAFEQGLEMQQQQPQQQQQHLQMQQTEWRMFVRITILFAVAGLAFFLIMMLIDAFTFEAAHHSTSPGEAAAHGSSLTTAVAAGGLSPAAAAAAAARAGPSAVIAIEISDEQVSPAACPPPTAQQPAAAGNSSSSSSAEAVEPELSSPPAADWAVWSDWPTEGPGTSTAKAAATAATAAAETAPLPQAAATAPAPTEIAPLPMATTAALPPPAAAGDSGLMNVNISLADDPTGTIHTITAHPQERVEDFKRRVATMVLGMEVDDVEEWNVMYDTVPSRSSSSDDSSSDSSISSSDMADAGDRDAAGATGDDCGDFAAAAVAADSEGKAAPPAAAAVDCGPSSSSSLSEIDRLRLDNEQLKEVVTHLHRESADTRTAAAAARTAAENQLTATWEALGCLQEQVDSIENRLQEVSMVATSGAAAAAAEASAGSSSSTGDCVRLPDFCGLVARHSAATDSLISELTSMTIGFEESSGWTDPASIPDSFQAALLLVPSQLQAARTATAALAAMANSINTTNTARTHSSSSSSGGSGDVPDIINSPCHGDGDLVVPLCDMLADLTADPPPLTSLAQASATASVSSTEALPAAAATAAAAAEEEAADTAADQVHDGASHTSSDSSDSSDDEVSDSDLSQLCQLPCGEGHNCVVPPDMGGVEDEYMDDDTDGSSSSGSSSTGSDDSIPGLAEDSDSGGSSCSDGPPSLYDPEGEEFSSDGHVPDLVGSEEYLHELEASSGPAAVGAIHQASDDADIDTEDMPSLESDDGNSSSSIAGNDEETPLRYQPLLDDVLATTAGTACSEPSGDGEPAPASPANSTAAMVSAAAAAAADTCSLHSVPLGAPSSAPGSPDTSEAAAGSNGSWDMDGGAAGSGTDDGECSSDGWQQVEMMMMEEEQEE